MYDSFHELIDSLAATPTVLQALLQGVTQEQARAARGGDENWSVVEVMCHLRDTEERAIERLRTLRDDPNPLIAGYDQEVWARERNYAGGDLREALFAFLGFREEQVKELSALTPEQWEKLGQHSEYGDMNIFNHTLHMASHDAVHLAQIAKQLR